ncbi:MAG: hypothetical protein FVQ80_00235 [Planctomycetes bacterium]|nr:hypothetical protein [Planctomycetota bacterium]
MAGKTVRRSLLVWWAGGLFLGLVQIFAIGLKKPLGVSTQFVVLDTIAIKQVASEYVESHPVISKSKYQKLGYGFWLDVGIVAGAFLAAVLSGRFKIRFSSCWWEAKYGNAIGRRMLAGFFGGFLILLGSRIGHGCTSGQFMSGWAQLSLSAIPFTVALFGFGMLTAYLVYRGSKPEIEK